MSQTFDRESSKLSSKLNKLLSEDDPKPGPSNSAADFDLEVRKR